MAFEYSFSLALLLSVWSAVICEPLVDGVLQVECNDRYFMMALDLAVTGENPKFEAVDRTGAHAITEEYAAKCGYALSVLPFLGLVELRASYFSCHTEKNVDFMFKFNLIKIKNGKAVVYTLNQTCSPSAPFASREVVCEVNYMEVSVRSDLTCSSEMSHDWDALRPAYSSSASDWQVTLQKPDEVMLPMNLSEARQRGYVFDLRYGRIVFRTPYGQPDSFTTVVNGVPVEAVHATLFSKQSWVVFLVELVAVCSINEGSFSGDQMKWEVPEGLYPSLNGTHVSVGLNGDLVDQAVAEQMGLSMQKDNTTVHVGFPLNAEGGFRKSLVNGGIFEFYLFHLYVRQITVDGNNLETVVLYHRILITPLLPRQLVTRDLTNLDEGMFIIFLGNIPDDVELTSVQLNTQEFTLPLDSKSGRSITEVSYANGTHSYTLKVPLNDSVVTPQFSRETATMLHKLDVNYTLTVLGNIPYHHIVSVTASTSISPPDFAAICMKSGIHFEWDLEPTLTDLWDVVIGSDVLTQQLAAKRGYKMTNDGQKMLLDVPLFTQGYKYKNTEMMGFLGTFEILLRDRNTSKVQTTTAKTCAFNSTDFIFCSTNGWLTVATDLSAVLHSGESPASTHLINELCVPKEVKGTRVLFSFPLNSCGSAIKLDKGNVTYTNKIYYSADVNSPDPSTEVVTVQCTYPLDGLHRLFSVFRFESETEGFGAIKYSMQPTTAAPTSTADPLNIITPQKTQQLQKPVQYLTSFHPTARYVKIFKGHNLAGVFRKGSK